MSKNAALAETARTLAQAIGGTLYDTEDSYWQERMQVGPTLLTLEVVGGKVQAQAWIEHELAQHVPYNMRDDSHPRCTFTPARLAHEPGRVVTEIRRKVIDPLAEVRAEAQRRKEADDAWRARRRVFGQQLAALMGGDISEDDRGMVVSFFGDDLRASVTVSESTADLDISAGKEDAVEIATLIGKLRKRHGWGL